MTPAEILFVATALAFPNFATAEDIQPAPLTPVSVVSVAPDLDSLQPRVVMFPPRAFATAIMRIMSGGCAAYSAASCPVRQ